MLVGELSRKYEKHDTGCLQLPRQLRNGPASTISAMLRKTARERVACGVSGVASLERVWDRNISVGCAFDEVIEEALRTARCVVVLWSKAAVASRWVRAEAL